MRVKQVATNLISKKILILCCFFSVLNISSNPLLNQARLKAEQGYTEEAVELYSNYFLTSSSFANKDFFEFFGLVYDVNEQIQILKTLVRSSQENKSRIFFGKQLALRYELLGDFVNAAKMYESIFYLSGEIVLLYNSAWLHLELGDYDMAEERLSFVLQNASDPDLLYDASLSRKLLEAAINDKADFTLNAELPQFHYPSFFLMLVSSLSREVKEEDVLDSDLHHVLIQTGSFIDQKNAEAMKKDLLEYGYKAEIDALMHNDTQYYRVLINGVSRSDVQNFLTQLKEKGFDGFPVQK